MEYVENIIITGEKYRNMGQAEWHGHHMQIRL